MCGLALGEAVETLDNLRTCMQVVFHDRFVADGRIDIIHSQIAILSTRRYQPALCP